LVIPEFNMRTPRINESVPVAVIAINGVDPFVVPEITSWEPLYVSPALLVSVVAPEKSATLSAAPPLIVPAPEVPADPDVPELPTAPFAPEVPELPLVPAEPEVPVLPELPEVPELPLVPDEPEVPELPVVPELPLVPVEPELPEVPALPLVPVEPELPLVPALPDVPFTPEVPEEPDVPAEPLVPVLPDEPDVPVEPELPEVPELPDVPELPAVPAGVNANDAVPKNPTPFTIELVKDDAETVPATVICDPLSVIIDSTTCSSPSDFNTLFFVNNVSFPTLLYVCGPINATEDVIPFPAS
jgi:hypothetical protein